MKLVSKIRCELKLQLQLQFGFVLVLLHSLESNDDTPSVINVNSFYARHTQALKVKALRRPSSIQS